MRPVCWMLHSAAQPPGPNAMRSALTRVRRLAGASVVLHGHLTHATEGTLLSCNESLSSPPALSWLQCLHYTCNILKPAMAALHIKDISLGRAPAARWLY